MYVDGDRERIPYEGDAYINQLGHYGVDRDYQLARHSLEYLIRRPTWPTEWILHCVPMAWADYRYTGDTALLAAYYDGLRHKVLLPLAREDGLISTATGLVTKELQAAIHLADGPRDLVDWPARSPGCADGERDGHQMLPINTVINAFHQWNLALFSRISGVLGRTEEQRWFADRAERVAQRLQELLYDRSRGCFVDGEGSTHASQHASLFPAAMGLVPAGEEARVAEFLTGRAIGYTLNRSDWRVRSPRALALCAAIYACL